MKTESGIFDRTEKLIGTAGLEILKNSRVILFGVGGVGSFVAEALIRSGVGFLTIVDKDVIEGRKPWPASGVTIDPRDGRMVIATLEGGHWVNLGDWIIRGVQGEFYPCKPDIFEATYEVAS